MATRHPDVFVKSRPQLFLTHLHRPLSTPAALWLVKFDQNCWPLLPINGLMSCFPVVENLSIQHTLLEPCAPGRSFITGLEASTKHAPAQSTLGLPVQFGARVNLCMWIDVLILESSQENPYNARHVLGRAIRKRAPKTLLKKTEIKP